MAYRVLDLRCWRRRCRGLRGRRRTRSPRRNATAWRRPARTTASAARAAPGSSTRRLPGRRLGHGAGRHLPDHAAAGAARRHPAARRAGAARPRPALSRPAAQLSAASSAGAGQPAIAAGGVAAARRPSSRSACAAAAKASNSGGTRTPCARPDRRRRCARTRPAGRRSRPAPGRAARRGGAAQTPVRQSACSASAGADRRRGRAAARPEQLAAPRRRAGRVSRCRCSAAIRAATSGEARGRCWRCSRPPSAARKRQVERRGAGLGAVERPGNLGRRRRRACRWRRLKKTSAAGGSRSDPPAQPRRQTACGVGEGDLGAAHDRRRRSAPAPTARIRGRDPAPDPGRRPAARPASAVSDRTSASASVPSGSGAGRPDRGSSASRRAPPGWRAPAIGLDAAGGPVVLGRDDRAEGLKKRATPALRLDAVAGRLAARGLGAGRGQLRRELGLPDPARRAPDPDDPGPPRPRLAARRRLHRSPRCSAAFSATRSATTPSTPSAGRCCASTG